MPRARKDNPAAARQCEHGSLLYEPATDASKLGFSRPSLALRAKAAALKPSASWNATDGQFPAPLVLPEDDISLDLEYPPQNLPSWVREKDRNRVTMSRRTIYVAGPPGVSPACEFVEHWCSPKLAKKQQSETCSPPLIGPIADYLAAFYHGLPVRRMDPKQFEFRHWDEHAGHQPPGHVPDLIGLASGDGCTAIRTRQASSASPYRVQLNLNDVIDAMIEAVPADAYAFVLVVRHDLFEDADDEFVCGRAYGGSRVAVVSAARYDPRLDERQGISRATAWPASHCCDCIAPLAGSKAARGAQPKHRDGGASAANAIEIDGEAVSALEAAIDASRDARDESLEGMWLGRVCRTVCHELGHCFGIDHCMYYACSMQGSASLAEDVRQPPYLCPVDLAKLLRATGGTPAERYQALVAFCDQHLGVQLFAAYSAWLKRRIYHLATEQATIIA